MIEDVSNWEAAVGIGIATFITFVIDSARRWVSKQIDYIYDVKRKEAGLNQDEE